MHGDVFLALPNFGQRRLEEIIEEADEDEEIETSISSYLDVYKKECEVCLGEGGGREGGEGLFQIFDRGGWRRLLRRLMRMRRLRLRFRVIWMFIKKNVRFVWGKGGGREGGERGEEEGEGLFQILGSGDEGEGGREVYLGGRGFIRKNVRSVWSKRKGKGEGEGKGRGVEKKEL